MRPLEVLLWLANLFTFLVVSVPRLRALHWSRYSVLIGVGIAGVQVLVEGVRWQMIPAYTLSVVFFLVWLLQDNAATGRHGVQRPTSRLTTIFAVGLSVLGLTVSFALPILLPVFRFPRPTGPHAIGTVTYHWVDAERPEVFTADPNDHREVMVQIWYPAKPNVSSPRAPWMQDASVVVPAFERLLLHVPEFTLSHSKYITTNAIPSAVAADDESNFPVLILLHGTLGFRQHNTFQVEELVSHGYIVAAIDQPHAATMQLEGWAQAGPRGIDIHQTSMRTVFQSLPGDGYLVLVDGMFHVNLTDFPFLVWPPLRSRVGLSGAIDAQRAHRSSMPTR